MKLKINKISIKESITKKKDWSSNTNNKEGQNVIFRKEREKKEKKGPPVIN
jgi:hypothetical protein